MTSPAESTFPSASADPFADKPKHIEPKDIFKFVLDTRNFEITNFWQRCNYFLVLNTGLAIGFFNVKPENEVQRVGVACLGVIVCILWNRVALGSKFWQVHWERKLSDVEKMYVAQGVIDSNLGLFSQPVSSVKAEVSLALSQESHHGWIAKVIDWQVTKKPSVTQAMLTLASTFVFAWLGVALVGAWKLAR